MVKKLYRNPEEGIVAGVLAGIADYFDHDPVLWRLGFLLLLVLTAVVPMILFYLLAWIIMPKQPMNRHADYTL